VLVVDDEPLIRAAVRRYLVGAVGARTRLEAVVATVRQGQVRVA